MGHNTILMLYLIDIKESSNPRAQMIFQTELINASEGFEIVTFFFQKSKQSVIDDNESYNIRN